jgi:hypothetical protein
MGNTNYIFILISGLITAFSTLGAVFLTNKLNNERLIIQSEIDRKNKQLDTLNIKREELYTSLHQWSHDTQIIDMMFFHICNGVISKYYGGMANSLQRHEFHENLYSEEKIYFEKKKEIAESYAKIKTIITMYFPDLKQRFSEIDKFRMTWVDELESKFKPFSEKFFAGTYEEGKLEIQEKNQELWSLIEELLQLDSTEIN